MAPGMSPAWCKSTACRRIASGDGCCAVAAQTSRNARPGGLPHALIPPPLCQDLTNRSLEFGGTEVELTESGLEGDLAVGADQVKAAGPSLVGALGRTIHAIHHGGKGKVQPAEAER